MAPRRGWHRCERWFRRGYPCPFRELGVDDDDEDSDEERNRRVAERALPIPIVGERKKTEAIAQAKIINIEDYINEQPPIDVPVPDRVAANKALPPAGGPGAVPEFLPRPGGSGRPGAGVPPPNEAWSGSGARALAGGITTGVSAPYDPLGVGAAHRLWTAPESMPFPVSAKVIQPPRTGTAPIPFFENELARATQIARAAKPPTVPATVLGVRERARPVRSGFGTPPPEIARETKGVVNTTRPPRSNFSQRTPSENTWGIAATVGSAMAAIAIYALGRGGISGAAAIEKAITSRIPDNRSPRQGGSARGSVRPGGQVFDFWDMINGIGFQ